MGGRGARLGAVLALLCPFAAVVAQAPEAAGGVDEAINRIVEPIANAVSSVVFFAVPVGGAQLPLIVVWLIAAAIFFTV